MSQIRELDAASTTSSGSIPSRRATLVVCFDAESVDITKKSTIIQLCDSAKKTDGTIVYYASPTTIKARLKANSIINYTKHVLLPGSGLKELVMSGYHFLMQKCVHSAVKLLLNIPVASECGTDLAADSQGDRICIFGSSIGAFVARVLAGMLHSVRFHFVPRLVPRAEGLLPPEEAAQIPVAYKKYLRGDDRGDPDAGPQIDFVGVWNTSEPPGLNLHRTFPHIHTNPSIKKFRQALSIDAPQTQFKPILYDPEGPHYHNHSRYRATEKSRDHLLKTRDTSFLWFDGCHSDLIGGNTEAAQASIWWMLLECTGIQFDDNDFIPIMNTPKSVIRVPRSSKNTWRSWIQTNKPHLPPRLITYTKSPTTLSQAIHSSQYSILQVLLKQGVDPNTAQDLNNSDRTIFFWAVEQGDVEAVRLMLEYSSGGAAVNWTDENGRTPLSIAAQFGGREMVQLLLNHPHTDINSKDYSGKTPLSYSASEANEQTLRILLSHPKVSINTADNQSRTPLSFAAEHLPEVLHLFLEHKDTDLNSPDSSGRTPLGWAAWVGSEAAVGMLLASGEGVDVNKGDDEGLTPLARAALRGSEGIVRLLLGHGGVHVDWRDREGCTPLMLAAREDNGAAAVVRVLLEMGGADVNLRDRKGRTALVWAAMGGSEASVRVLLMDKYGVEVDARDCEGRSALAKAAELGREGIVHVLLDSVDVNLKDAEGCSPLLLATKGAHCAVIHMLLEQEGVDVNSRDNDGRTALSWAAGTGLTPAVELLLAQPSIELNSKDNEGRTPLSWAAKNGKLRAVQALLHQTRTDVNSRDDEGRTALWWTVRNGREGEVEVLLDRKDVDVNLDDKYGRTALSWAAGYGRRMIIPLLLRRKGIDVELKDREGRTALSWAAGNGCDGAVEMLVEVGGADVNAADSEGRTAVWWAEENRRDKCVLLLKR